jgi:hypothetical protein
LTNGSAYTFTSTATNSAGTSPPSVSSNSVTPVAPVPPLAPPGQPSNVQVTPGDRSGSVFWTAPTTGGQPAVYRAEALINGVPTGLYCQGIYPATQCTIQGLTNGQAYTVRVSAINGAGSSAPVVGPTPLVPQPPQPGNFTLGGSVAGMLDGVYVTLLTNGGSPLTLIQNGMFQFPSIQSGSGYNVTVAIQPPGQTCTVENGSGVANGNINNLEIQCVNNLYRIGGTVSGLAQGQRVQLVKNGVESIEVSTNGDFNFIQGVAWNGRYNVVVGTQPSTQTCLVSGGSDFIVQNNVTNIRVTCSSETVVEGQTLPRSGLIHAACGGNVLYDNVNYYTAPGRENTARLAICALANARLTHPDFFNDSVLGRHELIGGLEVQGYARDYIVTSDYGMVTLVQKYTGQTIAFQVTRPRPGNNNSGINVDFLDGSIGFTSHLTPPLSELPNGRWTMWITRGGTGTEGWGTVPAIQLLPDVSRDLGQVGQALNTDVTSQDIPWETYTLSGTVSGLATGERLRLVNNGVESLEISDNGRFTFNRTIAWNGGYNVLVATQSSSQTCLVSGGSGFNVQNNVTDIRVTCSSEAVIEGQTLPRDGLIYAACGGSTLYDNVNYYTAPGRENTARLAICALANARFTHPGFFNESVTSKHELVGGIEVQGYARDYLATSYYGMVTLVQKYTGQTIAFQVTRPRPGYNNSGINVDFLDGSIGFTSHLTPPLSELPNGRWTMWITRGGAGMEGWGTVPAIQLLPDVSRDLGQVGEALNPDVTSQDIDWSVAP